MTDHLPECIYHGGNWHTLRPCICDRLRACEQRVLLSKPNIELSAVYGYEAGRSDGLDAARDAVAALSYEDEVLAWRAAIHAALAAIDALRGDA